VYLEEAEAEGMEFYQRALAVAAPNLQKTLSSLGLNPEARGELKKDKDAAVAVNPFDELRKRRLKAEAKKQASGR